MMLRNALHFETQYYHVGTVVVGIDILLWLKKEPGQNSVSKYCQFVIQCAKKAYKHGRLQLKQGILYRNMKQVLW